MVFFALPIRCWLQGPLIRSTADYVSAPGDFAHALYLHFFRTGDLESLEARRGDSGGCG